MPLARSTRAAVVAVALVASAAACGDDGGSATTTTRAPTTETTAPARTTTDPPSEEEAILAAVEGYWRTIREANSEPVDPNHPGFDEYFADETRSTSRSLVQQRFELGQAVRYSDDSLYRHSLHLVSRGGTSAVVEDCAVDDTVLFEIASGRVLNDAVGTFLWEIRLARENGRWIVTHSTIKEQWEGVAGCAES